MTRNYINEAAWNRKVYKIFTFKARKDTGEEERLNKVLRGRSFPEWVRQKMIEDEYTNDINQVVDKYNNSES